MLKEAIEMLLRAKGIRLECDTEGKGGAGRGARRGARSKIYLYLA